MSCVIYELITLWIPLRSPGKKSSYSRDHLCHVNLWQVPPRIGRIGKGIGNAYTSCLACLKTQPWNIQIQLVIAGHSWSRWFSQEFLGGTLHQRDLLLGFRPAIRLGRAGMDHHALGRSCPNAWQQGAGQGQVASKTEIPEDPKSRCLGKS